MSDQFIDTETDSGTCDCDSEAGDSQTAIQQELQQRIERAIANLDIDYNAQVAQNGNDKSRLLELKQLLEFQQAEHAAHKLRPCLFCKETLDGPVAQLFEHMYTVHKFSIGLSVNLVYIEELLDVLRSKLAALQCIYCEKTFKSQPTLRQHMRKKKHMRINPRNEMYDKYYLINYLEPGKDWQVLSSETASSADEDESEENAWDDWEEQVEEKTKCLFCASEHKTPQECIEHMKQHGGFDLQQLKEQWKLDFYDTVKCINHIRSCISRNICPNCNTTFNTAEENLAHIERDNHYSVRKDAAFWKNAQLLIPVIDADPLITHFVDDV